MNYWALKLVLITLSIYSFTFVIVNGDIFSPLRKRIRDKTPFLKMTEVHFIDCRMCVGFWISALMNLFASPGGFMEYFWMLFATYGASYFLATQER